MNNKLKLKVEELRELTTDETQDVFGGAGPIIGPYGSCSRGDKKCPNTGSPDGGAGGGGGNGGGGGGGGGSADGGVGK